MQSPKSPVARALDAREHLNKTFAEIIKPTWGDLEGIVPLEQPPNTCTVPPLSQQAPSAHERDMPARESREMEIAREDEKLGSVEAPHNQEGSVLEAVSDGVPVPFSQVHNMLSVHKPQHIHNENSK